MNISKSILGLNLSIILILTSISLLEAKEYVADKNGNLNIEVRDRVIIVNGKVESVIHPNEPISIQMEEDYVVNIDDESDMEIQSEEYDVDIDDEIMVDMADTELGGIIVSDDEISVGDIYIGDDGISIGGITLGD